MVSHLGLSYEPKFPPSASDTHSSFEMDFGLETLTCDTVPFDTYSFQALVFVIDKTTNQSLPVSTSVFGGKFSGLVISATNQQRETIWAHDSETG